MPVQAWETALLRFHAGAQARSNVGAVGVMSTPELLAKRLQRQKAEREAMAGRISRPNLARRLLQPVQNQQPTQQQQQQPGRPMTNTGLSFSRTPKRSVEKQQPAPEEPTGVSVEELAKVGQAAYSTPAQHRLHTNAAACKCFIAAKFKRSKQPSARHSMFAWSAQQAT